MNLVLLNILVQLLIKRWARAELNRRSSPCQGDVIAPRPRALGMLPLSDYFRNLTSATID